MGWEFGYGEICKIDWSIHKVAPFAIASTFRNHHAWWPFSFCVMLNCTLDYNACCITDNYAIRLVPQMHASPACWKYVPGHIVGHRMCL